MSMPHSNPSYDRLPPFSGSWRSAADRRWHPVELAAMIVGFVLFWPIGLAVLAWKKFTGAPRSARFDVVPPLRLTDSGNTAFEDYKQAEIARLEEERRRLVQAQVDFAVYLDRLKRARDRVEFDQFMAERGLREPAPRD